MDSPGSVLVCSYRLGGTDGVAIEAAKWAAAFTALGWRVTTLAGQGDADLILPGLAVDANEPPAQVELAKAFAGADLVVVENLCSLPLNIAAGQRVAAALAGRPAILHHHDLASQRSALAHLGPPPDDPAWLHVCVNRRSTAELAAHGYAAVTSYNTFDPAPAPGQRGSTRVRAGGNDGDLIVLQPTRAIARKGIAAGLALAEALGAVYWLLGPDEDGYGPECARLLARAKVPVLRGTGATRPGHEIADAYAACDVVALPSSWEGFGNPSIESATHRRPLAVGPYPVARELRRYGFRWFDSAEPRVLRHWMDHPDDDLIEHNAGLARRYFSVTELPSRISELVASMPGLGAPRAVQHLPDTIVGA